MRRSGRFDAAADQEEVRAIATALLDVGSGAARPALEAPGSGGGVSKLRQGRSTWYLVLDGVILGVGWGFAISWLLKNATAIGFGLMFAGLPLLFAAYRTLPGRRK